MTSCRENDPEAGKWQKRLYQCQFRSFWRCHSFENQDAVDLSEVVNIYEAYSKAENDGSEYDLSKRLKEVGLIVSITDLFCLIQLLLFSCLNMLAANSRFWPMLRISTIHAGLLSIYGAISICGSDPVPVQNW